MEQNSGEKGLRLPGWFYWILAVAGCYIMYTVREVFLPFIISFVVGYILDPFVGALEKKGVSRAHAVVRVFLIVFLLFVLFVILIVPPVVRQVDQIEHNISRYLGEVHREGMLQYDRNSKEQKDQPDSTATPSATVTYPSGEPSPDRSGPDGVSPTPGAVLRAPTLTPAPSGTETSPASLTVHETAEPSDAAQTGSDLQNNAFVTQVSIIYLGLINRYPILKQHFGDEKAFISIVKSKQEQIGQVTLKVLSNISSRALESLSHIVFIILVPIMTFYFLCVMDPLKERIMFLIKDRKHKEEVLFISSEINVMLVRYLKGQIMVSGLFGASIMAAAYIVSFIFGTKYALLLGCIAGIMSIVPYFGMAITLASGALIALFTAAHHPLLAALILVAAITVVNQVFDNFISPRIVGEQVGLHPLWTLFALLAGSKLFGVMGMLIAVPIAATIKIFLIRLFPDLVEPIQEDSGAAQIVRGLQSSTKEENTGQSVSRNGGATGENGTSGPDVNREDCRNEVPEPVIGQKHNSHTVPGPALPATGAECSGNEEIKKEE